MKKRLLTIFIAIVMAAGAFGAFSVLTGCHFVQDNELNIARQVVASVQNPNDDSDVRNIYRFQVIQAINQQAQGQPVNLTERLIEQTLEQLIDNEFMQMELERMFEGNPDSNDEDRYAVLEWRDGQQDTTVRRKEWALVTGNNPNWDWVYKVDAYGDYVYYVKDYADLNELRRAMFDTIDNHIRAEERRMQIERDREVYDDENHPPADPTPEFPIRNPEIVEEHVPETRLWCPSLYEPHRIPGVAASADQISFQHQALRSFVTSADRFVYTHVRVHDEERLTDDRAKINAFYAEANYEGLYLWLPDSYLMFVIAGENIENQLRQQVLHRHLTGDISVSHAEVVTRFNHELGLQVARFSANHEAYAAAVSGNERILFRPNSNFFYVKHVLLPFNDDQLARLEAHSERHGVTPADIAHFRDVQLVNEIQVYARRTDGFNDYARGTFSAQQVLDMIVSEVNGHSASLRDADRRFTDFIYMFNTDPGAFSHHLGYAMPTDRNTPSGMVPEFEAGARELFDNPEFRPGMVLPRFATSDFGVHIMFFANTTVTGYMAQIHSFETPGQHRTWFDVFYEDIRDSREGRQMQDWANSVIIPARREIDDNGDSLLITINRIDRIFSDVLDN